MEIAVIFFMISLIFFIIISHVLKNVYHSLKNHHKSRILNIEEYLPLEEVQNIKQVSYLVMITLFSINIFYQIAFYGNDITSFAIYDIIICLFAISMIKTDGIISYFFIFSLMPFVSFDYLFLDSSHLLLNILYFVHLIGLFYVHWYFYRRFITYTKSNGLGYTILLLFGIILVSFLWTSFVEKVSLLDSFVMVSNAFTSNGYSILGHSIPGKINEIFLVWAGYTLSGVGTATLTLALVKRHYDKKFDELKELIEELKEEK